MRRPLSVGALAAVALGLAACGRGNEGPRVFDGQRFDTAVSQGEDARDLTIRVAPAGADRQAADKAARYAATKRCVRRYGSSAAEWARDPETGRWAVALADGARIYRTRCTG